MREFNWTWLVLTLLLCGLAASFLPQHKDTLYAVGVLSTGADCLRVAASRRAWLFPRDTDYLWKTPEGRLVIWLNIAEALVIANTEVTAEVERWYYMGASLLSSCLLLVGVHHAFVMRRPLAFTLFTFFFGFSLVAIIACGGLFW